MTPRVPPHEDPDLLARALGRTPACPPLAKLAAAALGELAESERAAVAAHAEGCPACGAELALAAGFREESATAAEVDGLVAKLRAGAGAPAASSRVLAFPAPGATRRAAPAWTRWAAAALLVLGVGLVWYAARTSLPPEVVGPGGVDVVRGGEIEPVAPLGEVTGAPAELAWRPVDGAARYRVELLDVAGDPLGEGIAVEPRFELPADLRALLRPHSRYAWRVTATAPDGHQLAHSAAIDFFVLAPASR